MPDNSHLNNAGEPCEGVCHSCGEPNGKFDTKPFSAWFFDYAVICSCGHKTRYVSDPITAEDLFTGAIK